MDAAAKTVESLTQHILPEKPHHLSYDTTWRYHPPPDDPSHRSGGPARFEEWHNNRLQYMTLVSQADRGTLLTRSYYDMREDPTKPQNRDVSTLAAAAAASAGGEKKKKLSLSDYKNKKTGGPTPAPTVYTTATPTAAPTSTPVPPPAAATAAAVAAATPPDPGIVISKEVEHDPAPIGTPPVSASDARNTSTPNQLNAHSKETESKSRLSADSRKPSPMRTKDSPAPLTNGVSRTARETPPEAKLPPKPPTLPARPLSPTAKKQPAAAEDDARPQKRPKAEDRRSADDRPTSRHDESQRRKDRPAQTARDAAPPKEDKSPSASSSASLPNGKSASKSASILSRHHPSPRVRPHNEAPVNGVRSSLPATNKNKASKVEAKADTSKAFVPPLLSPLNLNFNNDQDPPRANHQAHAAAKADSRKDDEPKNAAKMRRTDSQPGSRKVKAALNIPPLLSPTLPPIVEAALRREKAAAAAVDSDESDDDGIYDFRDTHVRDPLPMLAPRGNEGRKLQHRRRLIISLFIPPVLRSAVRRLLGPAASKLEAAAAAEASPEPERPRPRKRFPSDEAALPPPGRKRPPLDGDPADTLLDNSTAAKKPRTSTAASLPRSVPAPSTPAKNPTAMSRVSSSNSLVAQTPEILVHATPAAGPPTERRTNGPEGGSSSNHAKTDGSELRALSDKWQKLLSIAKTLKHSADILFQREHASPRAPAASSSQPSKSGEATVRLGFVLSLESIIAFVMGFQAQNTWRLLQAKRLERTTWASMFPLIEARFQSLRSHRAAALQQPDTQPLYTLLLLLHAVCVDELLACYALDHPSPADLDEVMRLERRRARLRPALRDANAQVDRAALRVDLNAWYSLDDVIDAALRALRRWCDDAAVAWTPEPTLAECWPIRDAPHA